MLEVSARGLGDAFAVAGGQQVEQQATGYGQAEPASAGAVAGSAPTWASTSAIAVIHGWTDGRGTLGAGRPSRAWVYSSKNSRSCGHSFGSVRCCQSFRASAEVIPPGTAARRAC